MKQRKKILLGAFLILVLILLIAVINGVMKRSARDQHPLVQVHSPRRFEQFALGEPILLHATARSPAGIARTELWVDDEFIAEIDEEGDPFPSPAILTARISPTTLGNHELIVRAVTPRGVTGQASLHFVIVDQPQDMVGADDETAASGEVSAADGASSSDNPLSGSSTLDIQPPSFADEAPGSSGGVFDMGFDSSDPLEPIEEPESLVVELVSLTTDADYEGVHCYLGLGDIPPRWYPDTDNDPSTDEDFDKLAPNTWDIASHLGGTNAIQVPWIADEPVPIEMSCVGIAEVGTDAVELGILNPSPDPSAWDGIIRQLSSEGGDGTFSLGYRVLPVEDVPSGVPLALDPAMSSPYNVRLQGASLDWDYEPGENEETATRFRIFINNVMVWEVPGDMRSTLVPRQAANPPCGESYRFHVESYRDGDWSLPSNFAIASSEYGDPGCRTIVVTFNSLITHNLGGDDDRDPGDVGPVDGLFDANDDFVLFDGTVEDHGLVNNAEYPINGPDGITTASSWHGTGPAQWRIDVPPDEGLSLGFVVHDNDRRGEWQYVCHGGIYLETEEFIEPHEGVIPSDGGPGSCEVTYSIDLVEAEPTGLGDVPPLPHLFIDKITLSASGDRPVIHFRNDGHGDWTAQDIEIRAHTTGGEFLGFYIFEGQFIPAGEIVPLSHPLLDPDRPLDLCVEVDPYDQVEEAFEVTGAWPGPISYCEPQPDLIITDVDREYGAGRMYITIQNIGEATVADQPLTLQLETADGRFIPGVFPASFDIPQLEFWESTVLEWDMSVHSSPDHLDDGYTVTINADYSIAETNEDNNSFEVPANPEFEFFWGSVELRWYPLSAFDPCEPPNAYDAELQTQTLSLSLEAVSPFGNRSLGSLTEEYEIEYPGLHFIGIGEGGPSFRFELDGTEELTAMITGEARRGASTEELGTVWWTPKGEDDQWGATQFEANLEHCSLIAHDVETVRTTISPPDTRRYACGPWHFFSLICQRVTE